MAMVVPQAEALMTRGAEDASLTLLTEVTTILFQGVDKLGDKAVHFARIFSDVYHSIVDARVRGRVSELA